MIAVFHARPGKAHAKMGHVVLDSPNRVAAVMTPATARELADSLYSAASVAELNRQPTKIAVPLCRNAAHAQLQKNQ